MKAILREREGMWMLISVHHHILVAFFDSTMNDYILLIVKCT